MMRVAQFTEALPKKMCEEIILKFEQKDLVHRNRPEYKFKECSMFEHPDFADLQMDVIKNTQDWVQAHALSSSITTFPKTWGYEGIRIKRYDVGDEFPWHVDVRDYESAKRFLVCMYYLNDDFEGGETEFGSSRKVNYTVMPETGKLVIFTPFWDNPHRGCKVTKGSKYIMNVYLHYL